MRPKISIVTPCFNAEKYIEQTILSILNQNYDNLEYIIIDGGSNDGTVDIIKKYEDKLHYWISEKDNGQSDAINKGIQFATGDIFNWVNADDYLELGTLSFIANKFIENKFGVFCTSIMLFNEKGNIRENLPTIFSKPIEVFNVLNQSGLNQMGMYWNLNLVKELGGVNTDFNYSMDLDLWKRFVLVFGIDNIYFDSRITAYFRMSNDSKTGLDFSQNFHLFDEENNAALYQYSTFAGNKYSKLIKIIYPNIKFELAYKTPKYDLPKALVKRWLTDLFFREAQKSFYIEDFKKAKLILKNIDKKQLDFDQLKNFKSYKRWSFIKSIL